MAVTVGEVFPTDEVSSKEKRTLLTPPEPLRSKIRDAGFGHILLSAWVSKISQQQLRAIDFKPHDPDLLLFREKSSFDDDKVLARHFDMIIKDDHVSFLGWIKQRRVSGSYLFVGVAFKEKDRLSDAQQVDHRFITYLRLTAGQGAAIEEVYRGVDCLNGTFILDSAPVAIHHYFGRGLHPDSSWSGESFTLTDLRISPDAERLLDLLFGVMTARRDFSCLG